MRLRLVLAALLAVPTLVLAVPRADAQVFSGPWSGLYVGAHGGFGWSPNNDPAGDGWAGGLQAGYNLQFGSAVLGVEADYTWANLNGSTTISSLPFSGKVDSLWSVRGRLGWSLANSLILYGTAGVGGFDASLQTLVGNISTTKSHSYDAAVVGGGAELLLTRSLMLRLEGLHYIGNTPSSWTGEGNVTLVRAGASFKF